MSTDILEAISIAVSIYLGVMCIPFGALFLAFYIAGRIVTPEDRRSTLGTYFGYFSLAFAVSLISFGMTVLLRWGDGDAELDAVAIDGAVRIVAAIALTASAAMTFKLGPMVLTEIRKAIPRAS